MSMIEFDEYKQKLLAQKPTLEELKNALNIDGARQEYARLQDESAQEGFWSDMEHSQKVAQQIKRLENKIRAHEKLCTDWEDTMTLCEMAVIWVTSIAHAPKFRHTLVIYHFTM